MNRKIPFILSTLALSAACTVAISSESLAQSWSKQYDGVEYASYNGLHAVRIDLDLVGVSITPKISVKGEAMTPTAFAKTYDLQFAINANFFDMSNKTNVCSIVVADGTQWGSGWSPTTYASIGFTRDNRLKTLAQSENAGTQSWMYNVVSGIPEIVRDGKKVSVVGTQACKELGHCSTQAYRSGIAYDKSGKYLILAVTSGTLTIEDFANRLISVGAYYAINLDGGGSSGMYLKGKSYGNNVSGRTVAVNLGFKIGSKPEYVCKASEIDNPSGIFYDLQTTHWAYNAAKALYDKGITKGCGTGENSSHPLFCPNCGNKRIQAAQFIARALGLSSVKPSQPSFADVTKASVGEDAWGAVEACLKAGIISKADKFRPDDVITRAEGATMLARAYPSKLGGNIDIYAAAPTPTFTDVPKSHWSYAYVEAMARNCFVSGKGDGLFDPNASMSRAEFATVLARIAGLVTNPTCAFSKACTNNGNVSCSGNNVSKCIAYELVTEKCGSDLTCKDGKCVTNQQCTGSSKTCEGTDSVRACVDGQYVVTSCDTGMCENGKCVSCMSSSGISCIDNAIVSCVDGQKITQPCGQNETCKNSKCVSNVQCSEYDFKCNGEVVYQCIGYSWNKLEDCSQSDKVCQDGQCFAKNECSDGATACSESGKLKTCTSGHWTEKACSSGEVCLDGTCKANAECSENDSYCEDGKVKKCQSGAWVVNSCNSEQICADGACVDKPSDDPVTPDDPDDPVTPDDPDDPVTPDDPDDPVTPDDPDDPVTPDDPDDPVTPDDPDDSDDSDDPDEERRVVFDDGGCSQGNGSGHPIPWILALLGTFGLMMRRRRTNK